MKRTLAATLAALCAATALAGYLQHVPVDVSDSRQNFPLRVARGEVVDLSVDFFDEGVPLDLSGSPFVSLECRTNGMPKAESFQVLGVATNGNSALFRVRVDDFCPEASGTWSCVVSNRWATLSRAGGPVFVRGTAAATSHAIPRSALDGYATTNYVNGAIAGIPPPPAEEDPVFAEWAGANTNRFLTEHQSLAPATNYTDEAVARATGNYGVVSNRAMRAALLDAPQTFSGQQNFARVPTVKVTGAGNPPISFSLYNWDYGLYFGNSADVSLYSYSAGENFHNDIFSENAKAVAANGETYADFGSWGNFTITYTTDDWETSESATFYVEYAEFYFSGGAFQLHLGAYGTDSALSYSFSATIATSYYDEGYGDNPEYYGYGWATSTSSSLYGGGGEELPHYGFDGVEVSSYGFEPVVSTRLVERSELDGFPGRSDLAGATNATLNAALAAVSSATGEVSRAAEAYADGAVARLAAGDEWCFMLEDGILALYYGTNALWRARSDEE